MDSLRDVDNVLILPAVAVGLIYAFTDAISWTAFVATLVVLGTLWAGLVVYWVLRRIQPLQNEIAALRGER